MTGFELVLPYGKIRAMAALTTTASIVETGRGPSIAGTRTTVFSVMDFLKSGESRERIKQLLLISDDQLDAVLEYLDAHKSTIEKEYSEIVRRSEIRKEMYERIFRERSPISPDLPAEQRRELLHQRLMKKQATPPPPQDGSHHSSRS